MKSIFKRGKNSTSNNNTHNENALDRISEQDSNALDEFQNINYTNNYDRFNRDSFSPQTDDTIAPRYETIPSNPIQNFIIPEYNEKIIEPQDYVKNLVSDPIDKSKRYLFNLFPIFKWIGYYPSQPKWILSDFITGVSVAIVLIPQAMSYAKLAGLAPEYGLYSSFIGLIMYSIFATSKDVSIGPVAVMSLEVSKIIQRIQEKYGDEYSAPEIAITVALLSGAITLGVGLLKLGFLVELIPLPAVMAFTTGSSFNIISSQLPGLMGFSKEVNNHDAPYLIIIHFLKHLKDTNVDAAFGLVALFILYLWKYLSSYMIKRDSKRSLFWTYILNVRTAIVIIFSTLISYLIVRHDKENPPFSITGHVRSGFQNLGVFHPPANLASRIGPDLPVATIVLVLEHISIAKSFGRLHDYKIDPNQEFIAIGVTNLIGTFFNAYPATGSFSRTALASKCGVKTPFASIFAGFCVLLAIYCFTSAFYYIPKATLCAIIIHAVSDLMASWKSTWKMYLIQPVDCGIFLVGVFVSVFSSIEYGIYWAMCSSCAMIIWRMCWANGTFMGRIKIVEIVNPTIVKDEKMLGVNEGEGVGNNEKAFLNSGLISMADSYISTNSVLKGNVNETTQLLERNIVSYNYRWVPLKNSQLSQKIQNPSKVHTRYVNQHVEIEQPPPGVVVYRMSESFVYPNSSSQCDAILDYIKENMRSAVDQDNVRWNNIHEVRKLNWNFKSLKFWDSTENDKECQGQQDSNHAMNENSLKPLLKVLHLDFSQVVATDATSIQSLIDLRKAISLFTNSEFEVHFSGIINPWVIRGLVSAGFGGKVVESEDPKHPHVENNKIEVDIEEDRFYESENESHLGDLESGIVIDRYVTTSFGDNGILYPVFGTNLPHFHLDIPSYSEYK